MRSAATAYKQAFLSWPALVFLGLLLMGCGGPKRPADQTASKTPETGSEVKAQEVVNEYLRRDAAAFRKERVRFTITEEGRPPIVYEIDSWRKQAGGDTTTLTRIVKPSDEADLASLTEEKKGESAVVVTYAASQNQFRETNTNKRFLGGLTAGELLGEWGKFTYRSVGVRDIDGKNVFDLEGRLRPDADSTISRMMVSFRADDYLPVEMHLFDASDREVRTYRAVEIKSDAKGDYPSRTEVDNPVFKTRISIEILDREFPATIDDAIFSREELKPTRSVTK